MWKYIVLTCLINLTPPDQETEYVCSRASRNQGVIVGESGGWTALHKMATALHNMADDPKWDPKGHLGRVDCKHRYWHEDRRTLYPVHSYFWHRVKQTLHFVQHFEGCAASPLSESWAANLVRSPLHSRSLNHPLYPLQSFNFQPTPPTCSCGHKVGD